VNVSRALGFAGLLFDAYTPSLSLPDLSATGRREFLQVLSGGDQRLVGLQGDLGPRGFGPGADVDRLIARIDRAMEAAAGLRAPLLCLEIGPLPPPPRAANKSKPPITPEQAGLIILPIAGAGLPLEAPPEPEMPPMASPQEMALASQVNAALVELGVRADRYGVTIAFSSALASFASLEQALLAARCPWFGVDLDPVAMLGDGWAPDEVFSRLGALIRHVRARDAVRGAGGRTKPVVVGKGHVDWAGLLARLDQSGYSGWLTVDPTDLPDRRAAAAEALRVLNALV
jgi:sugar phosphate isomerase/epimerase